MLFTSEKTYGCELRGIFFCFQSDFYKINGTYYSPAFTITTPTLLKQVTWLLNVLRHLTQMTATARLVKNIVLSYFMGSAT